jgi:hypothetical protein
MSESRRWRVWVTASSLLTVLCHARGVSAQSPTDPLAGPLASLHKARVALEAARAAWEQDSLLRTQLPLVERIGGIAVRADTAAFARTTVTVVLQEVSAATDGLRSTLGTAADAVLADGVISVLGIERTRDSRLARIWNGVSIRFDLGGTSHAVGVSAANVGGISPGGATRIRGLIAGSISERLTVEGGATLRTWPGTAPRLHALSAEEREIIYRGLRLNPSSVARACHDGALAACATGLALHAATTDTIDAWLDAAQRRMLVRERARDTVREPGLAPLHRDCVTNGADSVCRLLVVRSGVRPPLGIDARRELLRLALVRGGDGAWARLREVGDRPPTAMLEYVSGVPADTLVAALRAEVLAGRAPSPSPAPSSWLTSGLGALLVAGLVTRRRIAR